MRKITPLAERFWAKVDKTDECWNWTASIDGVGYGKIGVGRRGAGCVSAHRWSWEQVNGPIPEGMYVLHRCDNQLCVRPDHLFIGTQADNMADMASKGRSHSGDKLTVDDVRAIRSASASQLADMAERYGVSRSHISDIRGRRRWPSVD